MKGKLCRGCLQTNSVNSLLPAEILIKHFSLLDEFKSGGSVWCMKQLDPKANDYHDLFMIGRLWAKQGLQVLVLAPIHFKDNLYPLIFGPLIGTRYERKCPDLLVNGKYFEYESFKAPWNRSKLSNMFKNGLKQSSRVIMNNNKGCSLRFYQSRVLSRIKSGDSIEELWIFEHSKLICLYKKTGGLI